MPRKTAEKFIFLSKKQNEQIQIQNEDKERLFVRGHFEFVLRHGGRPRWAGNTCNFYWAAPGCSFCKFSAVFLGIQSPTACSWPLATPLASPIDAKTVYLYLGSPWILWKVFLYCREYFSRGMNGF